MADYSYSKNAIYHFRIALFRKASTSDFFDGTIKSLYGKSFARLEGSVTSPEFDEAVKNGHIRVESVPELRSKFRLLSYGRVDFATGIWLSSLKLIEEEGLENDIVASNFAVNSRPAFLAMPKSKENDEFLRKFDVVIEKLNKDGTIKKIIADFAS